MTHTTICLGHYARKSWSASGPELLRARDRNKDQTYYLSQIPESSLARTLFPLGELTKPEVRELASKHGLPTASREESMGICFVGEKRRFNDFLCMCSFSCRQFTPDKFRSKIYNAAPRTYSTYGNGEAYWHS
jgi:tRNA U34 2-thiouridine synthase MnmA/TrmU